MIIIRKATELDTPNITAIDHIAAGEEERKQHIKKWVTEGNTKYVNNWDLVDSSGPWLSDKDRSILYGLVNSKSLWERRISIMSTFHFIKNGEFSDTLKISEILINDPNDLVHKAVGWMLREVGKRDRNKEEIFLKKHYQYMPRTMLRYAIEKFPENLGQQYLKGNIK